jgi:protein-arginine kinase activator protein McsA
MEMAAENWDFENAIIFRDQLEILERKSKNAKNK